MTELWYEFDDSLVSIAFVHLLIGLFNLLVRWDRWTWPQCWRARHMCSSTERPARVSFLIWLCLGHLWWLLIRHGDCQERGREAECSAQQVLKLQSVILLPPDLCQVWLVVEALHCQRLACQVGHNGGIWTYRQFQRDLPARRRQMWQVLSSCFALWNRQTNILLILYNQS